MTDPTRHFGDALLAHVRARLDDFPRVACTQPGLRPAAVALVITADAEGRASFLITRRTSKLKRHAHQWALPGGRLDAGETVEEAALRETREEIGLALSEHAVLGLLDDFPTRSGFRMTPVVVWGDPSQTLRPDPHEVERVHTVPLAELDRPEVPVLSEIPESDRPLLSIPIPMLGTSIHSPTAAILFQMREVLIHGRHTRVSHYEQPVFAWK
ncbi:MAG TPA: CoA pyrophosphatase [Myxococcota bacterium]|nr:CoA pyrophosphatase [Myxococcales bacterium]HPG25614.1 CoA pyrophosphatase [Myxococcota bacterium]